jgi:hypothetical protein
MYIINHYKEQPFLLNILTKYHLQVYLKFINIIKGHLMGIFKYFNRQS